MKVKIYLLWVIINHVMTEGPNIACKSYSSRICEPLNTQSASTNLRSNSCGGQSQRTREMCGCQWREKASNERERCMAGKVPFYVRPPVWRKNSPARVVTSKEKTTSLQCRRILTRPNPLTGLESKVASY